MSKLLVDYHFHPNLSKIDIRAKQRCIRLWTTFQAMHLDVVIITEHVFKNPTRAYELLLATRPADATTIIFPGLEAITREGIDIIVFEAEPDQIYHYKELMVPKQFDIFGLARFIRQDTNLFGSVAHPFSIGNSGVVRQLGVQVARDAIQQYGGVEIHNSCFTGALANLRRCGALRLIPKKHRLMDWTVNLPAEYYDHEAVHLYTGGSDSHTYSEIGSGMLVPAPDQANRLATFAAVAHNHSTEFYFKPVASLHPLLGLQKIYTVIREATIKAFRLYEGRIYQNDDQFTNWFSEAEKETVLEFTKQRSRLLQPLLNVLSYFGVRANHAYTLSLLAIVISAFSLMWYPISSLIAFVIYLLAASGADALARYQHRESESHAITQVTIQHLLLSIFILFAIGFHWTRGVWGASYLLLYTVMLWLVITLNKIGEPIRVVIRSRLVIIASMYLFVFTRWNFITPLLIGFSTYMTGANVWMFYKLRQALGRGEKQ